MNRVHGPYRHHGYWRLLVVDENGHQVAERYETEEEALAALAVHSEALRSEAMATVLTRMAVAVPESPAWVYFLHDPVGDIVYVGVTGSLSRRLAAHREAGVEFASATCIPSPFARAAALRLEAALVRELRPKLNVQLQLRAGNTSPDEVIARDL
jgi:predicted GIY-YIG superfamily endonuclease